MALLTDLATQIYLYIVAIFLGNTVLATGILAYIIEIFQLIFRPLTQVLESLFQLF